MLSRFVVIMTLVAAVALLALSVEPDVTRGSLLPASSDLPGDVNCDDQLTVLDPLELLKAEAGLSANDDCAQANADLTCDDEADAGDIPQLLRLLAGLEPQTCTPAGSGVPTSIELVDAALLRGDIDSDTAIRYKLYAVFGDSRLPGQYASSPDTESGVDATSFIKSLAADYDSLSQQMRQEIGPFLVPPFYDGSWWGLQNAQSAVAPQGAAPCQPREKCTESPAWSSAEGVNVKVWYPTSLPNGGVLASGVVGDVDNTIWPKLKELLGRTPPSDADQPANGGNGKLDISIVPGAVENFAEPYVGDDCSNAPNYVVISPVVAARIGNEALTHEVMHSFQFAFDVAGSHACDEWDWVAEATAHWATDFMYPSANWEHPSGAIFLNQTEFSVNDGAGSHEYGAWIWFKYLSEKYGDSIIRTIWEASESNADSLVGVNSAIPGGWEERWPEFAAYAWNRPPGDFFKQWDDYEDQLDAIPHYEVKLGGGEGNFPGATTQGIGSPAPPMPFLSAVYYEFEVDPEVRSLAIYNGLAYELAELDTDLGKLINIDSFPDVENLRISLLTKINGVWQEPVDWTQAPFQYYCLDIAAERVEEVVLVATNVEYMDRTAASTIRPEGLPVTAHASDIGCARWEGSITQIYNSDGFMEKTELKNAVFERDPAQVGPYGGSYNVNYFLTGGSINWTVSGSLGDCTVSGNKSGLLPQQTHHMGTINHLLSGTYFRTANASLSVDGLQPYTVNCPGDPPEIVETTVGVSLPFHEDGSSYTFDDGGVIDDTSAFGPWTVTYHLEAKRE